MSHCAWISIMESFYFGVMIIVVLIKLDLPLNGRLGVEVEKDENRRCNGDEVAKAIKKVVIDVSGENLRFGAKILRAEMKDEDIDEEEDQLFRLCKTRSKIQEVS
ncbi:cyanidin-3-o-glucoside 2-o-glucuronosyltransferase [Phtheirospermum japonicum]|uniref:Cyanidin-3-o-glucoside 2-o-glucuronosyltransferase n=1 Tax=Phtheirospermum japonicum TaxID=374723 RepID=A0A830CJI5_9LAMI|nr:cyanidin-3-o-glucoside 2-o-glucuronosyltransferase [Phtheirospermum japonicum]